MKENFLSSMGHPVELPETSRKMPSTKTESCTAHHGRHIQLALFSTNTGGASLFDRDELMMIMTEIDSLQFVDNKNIFLENILKLASFQCLVQVEWQCNSVTSPVRNKRTTAHSIELQ